MTAQPPSLDTRSADDVVSEVEKALSVEPINWHGVEGGAGHALVRVFGRLSELVINRLNQMPENHFREFLNTAGIDLLPPRNAKVDLAFTPIEDGPDVISVPAGTQVNTQPSASSPDELIFETEKTLNVFNNSLGSCIAFDPNTFADRTQEANDLLAEDFPAFEGRKDKQRQRILFLSDRTIFSFPDDFARKASTITLRFAFDQSKDLIGETWNLEWLYWDWDEDRKAGDWKLMPIGVVHDGEFRRSGEVSFTGIPAVRGSSVGGIMFCLGKHLLPDLEREILSPKLRQEFRGYGAPLAADAKLTTVKKGEIWQISSDRLKYNIIMNREVFEIYLDPSAAGVLFSLDKLLLPDLKKGILPSELYQEFEAHGVPLVKEAKLTVKEAKTWQISSDKLSYTIVNDDKRDKLEIYQEDVEAPWIACRLTGDAGGNLPVVQSIKARRKIEVSKPQIAGESVAFSALQGNTAFAPIMNLSDEFYPFGQIPGRMDTFYLSADEAFSKPGAMVTISMTSLQGIPRDVFETAADAEDQADRRKEIDDIKIVWEYFSTKGWTELGSTAMRNHLPGNSGGPTKVATANPAGDSTEIGFTDTTCAFTGYSTPPPKDPTLYIRFTVPKTIGFKRTLVAERDGYWVRARLVSGSYTLRAFVDIKNKLLGTYVFHEAKTYAPLIKDLKVEFEKYSPKEDQTVLALCRSKVDEIYRDHSMALSTNGPAAVFEPREKGPALYLGFRKAFPAGKLVSLLIDAVEGEGPSASPLTVLWEYWNGTQWIKLKANDASQGLTVREYLDFVALDDHQPSVEFGQTAYWLRACPTWLVQAGHDEKRKPDHDDPSSPIYSLNASGSGDLSPAGRKVAWYHWRVVKDEGGKLVDSTVKSTQRLRKISMNVVRAVNAETVKNEVLGSGDGKNTDLTLSLARAPVLEAGVIIAIREPDWPPQSELDVLEGELRASGEESEPKLEPPSVPDKTGWVRWHQVPHFSDSGKDSRHYMLDPTSGKVRFGDGIRGKIPPAGRDNIRAVSYRAHNGAAGNVPAGLITVLRNPSDDLANIRSVTNHEPAAGGSIDDTEKAKIRGPRTLKHRNRAVTQNGYGWLVQELSTQVAHAYGFQTLGADGRPKPGCVTVVVVPTANDEDYKPVPTPALLREVKNYLNERALTSLVAGEERIHVKGPEYVGVNVMARVVAKDRDKSDQVSVDVHQRLKRFLHPINGGPGGSGWGFGDDVFLSEIAAVIEALEGVDYVSRVHLSASLIQSRIQLCQQLVLPYDLPAGSQVSTFDDRTKLVLAESVYKPDDAATDVSCLFVAGFKVQDEVVLVADDGSELMDDLRIAKLTAEDIRITFDEKFQLPPDWDGKGSLRLADDQTRIYPLIEKKYPPGDPVAMSVRMAAHRDRSEPTGVELDNLHEGDRVIIFDNNNKIVWPNRTTPRVPEDASLKIHRVSEEEFHVGFQRPFPRGPLHDWITMALRSKDGPPIQLPLSGAFLNRDNSDEVVAVKIRNLTADDRVSVVVDGRRHSCLELLKIQAIDRRDDRIFVPEDCLVFSDKPDIRMALE